LKEVGKEKMKSRREQECRVDKNERREESVERGCRIEYVEEGSFELGAWFGY
jgi:hypothetical protein